ncbi:hypothetical protein IFT45_16230, partial [Frigoribacterium sp. CFBP 13707]|nr:hypothetical protein [Frigoribacterium sp. CFBP 13707]
MGPDANEHDENRGGASVRTGPVPRRRRQRRVVLSAAVVALALLVIAALLFTGTLWPTRTAALRYPVQGVDVSAYQGTINWDVLAEEDIDFAWIKATEGSSYQDPRFDDNWA